MPALLINQSIFRPANLSTKAFKLSTSLTSTFSITSTPSALSSLLALRQVAITSKPRCFSCVQNSKPIPRLLPVTNAVLLIIIPY